MSYKLGQSNCTYSTGNSLSSSKYSIGSSKYLGNIGISNNYFKNKPITYFGLESAIEKYNLNKNTLNNSNDINKNYFSNNIESFITSQMFDKDKFKKEREEKEYNKNITYLTSNHFSPAHFLNQYRSNSKQVDNINQIIDYVKEAFNLTTNENLNYDIKISILNPKEFFEISSYYLKDATNTLGFAINNFDEINNKKKGKIFVKMNKFDETMLVLGHEIGHLMSKRLPDIVDEEAKAFAFSIAWMDKIKKYNIANLNESITQIEPAKNNIHDKALNKVFQMIDFGKLPFDIFEELKHQDKLY